MGGYPGLGTSVGSVPHVVTSQCILQRPNFAGRSEPKPAMRDLEFESWGFRVLGV